MQTVTDRGKRSEVKPVKNMCKSLQSFIEIRPMPKEVLPSHKLREHTYKYQNPFGLKEHNLSQRNCQNQFGNFLNICLGANILIPSS